ncbi:MAG: hypothetical protein JW891_03015 [Candidatus Lokiarchaeota archaeon]|nr:hypothetical protein [Candidatus Lokiarchaeota archaeon]
MRMAKGSVFKSVARGIRSDKTGLYEDLISEEAKELISKRILSSSWYPFEIYKNCLNAVARIVIKGNMTIVRNWGVDYFDELLPTVFKEGIKGEEIHKAMEKYKRFLSMVYNFGEFLVEYPSENELMITYRNFDKDFEVLYEIIRSFTEKFVETSVGEKTNSEFVQKSWEDAENTVLKIWW